MKKISFEKSSRSMQSRNFKKKVFFNLTNNTTRLIPRSNDGSREQKQILWFDEEEIERMCTEMHKTVRIHRSIRLNPHNICERGIEHLLTPHAFEQRRLHKDILIRSVLQEQSRQKITGNIDPEALSSVSKFHSRWSSELARSLCENDLITFDDEPNGQVLPNRNAVEILKQAMRLY